MIGRLAKPIASVQQPSLRWLESTFASQQSKASYYADFVAYPLAILGTVAFLLGEAPRKERLSIALFTALGLLAWSFLEYALHRFLLHGPQPFHDWHRQHHRHPRHRLGTPTAISALTLAGFVFLPTLVLGNAWLASGLTLGVASGYLAYIWTHHRLHHGGASGSWLVRRKQLHGLHHTKQACEYGVTTSFWDRVFTSQHASLSLARRRY